MLCDVDNNIITYDRNAWLIQRSPLWLWVECPFLCESACIADSSLVVTVIVTALKWMNAVRYKRSSIYVSPVEQMKDETYQLKILRSREG